VEIAQHARGEEDKVEIPVAQIYNTSLVATCVQKISVGETARNLYTRGKEHISNYEARNRESFMKNHQQEKHHGADADFSAEVTGRFKDCLSRQVSEGVHIRRSQHVFLNSKSEWHQPALWRIRSEIVSD
jgi:hypothetical protein